MLFTGAARVNSAGSLLKGHNVIDVTNPGAGVYGVLFARGPVSLDNVGVSVSQGGAQDMTCNWTLSLSGGNLHVALVFDIDTVNTAPTNGFSIEVTEL